MRPVARHSRAASNEAQKLMQLDGAVRVRPVRGIRLHRRHMSLSHAQMNIAAWVRAATLPNRNSYMVLGAAIVSGCG